MPRLIQFLALLSILCVGMPTRSTAQVEAADQTASAQLRINTDEVDQRLAAVDRLIGEARDLLADEDPARVASFTLRECLYVGLQNNLDIAVQRFEPEKAAADELTAQGTFDPELFVNYSYEDRTDPQGARGFLSTAGERVVKEKTVTLGGGVEGKAASGADYSVTGDRIRTASSLNTATGYEYEVNGDVSVTQPLLKNFGILVNTADIRIANRQRAISREEFRQQVMQSITEIHDAYWEVVRARENLRVTIDSLRVAGDLLRQNKIRLDVGTMAPLEVLQAEAGAATRAEALIVARQAVRDAEDNLKRLMNLPKNPEAWKIAVRPIDRPVAQEPSLDLDTAVEQALERRPEIQAAQLQLENNEINLLVARNQMLPDWSATGAYGVRGIQPHLDDALDQAGRTHTEHWLLGSDFRYPVFNRAARGGYHRAELEYSQQQLTITDVELAVTAEVRTAVRGVETAWERIRVNELASKLAAEQLAAEQKKLEVGVSTSFDVLQFEQELTQARSNEIAARIDYQQSLAAYDLAVARVLDAYQITIDTGQK